jgi:hypothetical protein
MGEVISFSQRLAHHPERPAPRLRPGAEVYLCQAPGRGWMLVDVSSSGDSAATHDWFETYAEGVPAGRRLAYQLGATFIEADGGAA